MSIRYHILPQRWAVCRRRFDHWTGKFRSEVLSRHKTKGAADKRCRDAGEFVRRLSLAERRA